MCCCMAFANLVLSRVRFCDSCRNDKLGKAIGLGPGLDSSNVIETSKYVGTWKVPLRSRFKSEDRLHCPWRLRAVATENSQSPQATFEVPVTCYQELLVDVRDKLLFEPEYAGNVKENIPPKSSLPIPWPWLPSALYLLQMVGEEKLVLKIGQQVLAYEHAKPYVHDVLLSMALAECAIAKISFENNKVVQGFEALARAQCLLRSKSSLREMQILSQIEESLEDLAPACTLELLGSAHMPENAERRHGAIAALHELVRQGLDVEASCQVEDWPCFLSQALKRLLASEIVDLLPWDALSITRKTKKSLESQNQRVVIDFNCFYFVLIAHIASGFSSKQEELISKAKTICESLMASEGADLKFEEAFCLFLLGQGQESEAVQKLQKLELRNPSLWNPDSCKKIKDYVSKPSLETWLKDAVLEIFPDTRDYSPSLISFFCREKGTSRRQDKCLAKTRPSIRCRPLTSTLVSDGNEFEETLMYNNCSHLGSDAKQLAQSKFQAGSVLDNVQKDRNESSTRSQPIRLERNLCVQDGRIWGRWLISSNVIGGIASVTLLGCFVFGTLKLSGMKFGTAGSSSGWASSRLFPNKGSLASTADFSSYHDAGPVSARKTVNGRLRKLLAAVKMKGRNCPDIGDRQSFCIATSPSSPSAVYKKPMPKEEAEVLVKQWQDIKAEALGPNHHVDSLSDILKESMLTQWQAVADAAKENSCFWRFVLLQLSILRVDVLSDGTGMEMVQIEALLEEAAELVDESLRKNPNYYSTYRACYVLRRQDDGSWRFCEGNIQKH